MEVVQRFWQALARRSVDALRGASEAMRPSPSELAQSKVAGRYPSNFWYAVLDEADLPRSGKVMRLRRFSTDLVVWRGADGVAVQEDRCPHKGVPLSLGRVVGQRLRCAYHAMEFEVSGACAFVPQFEEQEKIPKNFCVRTYPSRIEHGILWMWWGEEEPTSELPFFPEVAGQTRLSSSSSVDFPVGFVRVMESHFDLYHVDHLHGWPLILGRVVKESRVETSGRYIRCENMYEDPRSGKQQVTRSTVLFPGLSLQESQRDFLFKIVVAATPIDKDTTWFFMRHYFAPFGWPVVGPVLNAMNNANSYLRILPEDALVQSRQRPFESGAGSDQLIVSGDKGILEYWRMLRQSTDPSSRTKSTQRGVHDGPGTEHSR
jgi:phenylpropionate dioxygenase-like ring-hydroxylating dioxygenase large terminal subunit